MTRLLEIDLNYSSNNLKTKDHHMLNNFGRSLYKSFENLNTRCSDKINSLYLLLYMFSSFNYIKNKFRIRLKYLSNIH